MTTILMTHCSAEKDPAEGDLPAIRRYRSRRIDAVAGAAGRLGLEFLILSGAYGLLAAGDPVPWYDHLLAAEESAAMAESVAARLRKLSAGQVLYFARSAAEDPGAAIYLETARRACRLAGVAFVPVTLDSLP